MKEEVVSITDARRKIIKKNEQRMLDIRASYVALDHCYKYIGMNNLPELKQLKADIRDKMLEFRKIMQDGKKR